MSKKKHKKSKHDKQLERIVLAIAIIEFAESIINLIKSFLE